MERETVESRQTACAKAEPAAPDSEQPAPHAPSSATSMVLEIPKSIHECVMALAPHIKTMRTLAFQSNHDMTVHYELEARFGRCDDEASVEAPQQHSKDPLQAIMSCRLVQERRTLCWGSPPTSLM